MSCALPPPPPNIESLMVPPQSQSCSAVPANTDACGKTILLYSPSIDCVLPIISMKKTAVFLGVYLMMRTSFCIFNHVGYFNQEGSMVHRVVRGREVDEYITSYLSDSKPSSMNCVRFSTYPQHDRPSLNPLFSRQVFS